MILLFFFCTDVVIGFNETLITLGEGDGSTEVCIELMSPFITEIQYPITLEVVTTEVTAGINGKDMWSLLRGQMNGS